MKQSRLIFSLLICCASIAPAGAFAQTPDNAQMYDRLDKVERDFMLIQRQLSRGGSGTTGGDANLPAGGSAQLEVRLSAIEDQLRELRGKIEETDNRTRKLSESMEKQQRDVEFRLNELSAAGGAHAGAVNAGQQPFATAQTPPASGSAVTPLLGATAGTGIAPRTEADPKPPMREDLSNISTPRELYNYAFRLLNQTQYEEAATAFAAFTKKYPKDPLVGNAFYWGGETYYIRRDYVNAADHFRQGFEALPEGPKAADNLLKLAMSLNAVSRDKEACLVLQQVTAKFKKTSSSVSERAEQEQKRIGCKKP